VLVTQEFTIKVQDEIILDNINLEFGPGIHIVMGPNGVGKSTFAHALMGNPVYQTEGAAQLNGKDLLSMETFERAEAGLFLGFQTPTPIEGLSNFQLINQVLNNNENYSLIESLNKFKDLSNNFNLPKNWDKKQLNVEASGGEKKKNELIQMELLDPDVVILDEPDSGLDIDAIQTLITFLNKFANRPDKTIIIISHYAQLIKSLNVQSVSIIGKDKVAQGDVELAYDVLDNGFGKYV
tara:strand:- start:196 stop:909 length:714 start_codon:yes stop_codon:yes gene_type:complete